MAFQNENDRDRRRKTDEDPSSDGGEAPGSGGARRPRKKSEPTVEVGDALRTVYQRTIAEDIPPEMLDLLGKLG